MLYRSYFKALLVVPIICSALIGPSYASLKQEHYEERKTKIPYLGNSIKSSGILLIANKDNVHEIVLGLTTDSLKEKMTSEGAIYTLKPEYSPPSGHIDESDKVSDNGKINALETFMVAMHREVKEELGEAGYNYIFENGVLSANPVVSKNRVLFILTLAKPVEEVIQILNKSINTLPENEKEFREVSSFPLDVFEKKDLVDYGRHPLTSTQNLVKYYDKAVLKAVRFYQLGN